MAVPPLSIFSRLRRIAVRLTIVTLTTVGVARALLLGFGDGRFALGRASLVGCQPGAPGPSGLWTEAVTVHPFWILVLVALWSLGFGLILAAWLRERDDRRSTEDRHEDDEEDEEDDGRRWLH